MTNEETLMLLENFEDLVKLDIVMSVFIAVILASLMFILIFTFVIKE